MKKLSTLFGTNKNHCCNECDYVQTTGTITLFLTLHVPMAIFTDQSRLPYTLKCAAFSLHLFCFLDARWRCIIELSLFFLFTLQCCSLFFFISKAAKEVKKCACIRSRSGLGRLTGSVHRELREINHKQSPSVSYIQFFVHV